MNTFYMNEELGTHHSRLRVEAPVFLPQQQQTPLVTTERPLQQRRRQRNRPRNNTKNKAATATAENNKDSETVTTTQRQTKGQKKRRNKKNKEKPKTNESYGESDNGHCFSRAHNNATRVVEDVHWNSAEAHEDTRSNDIIVPLSSLTSAAIPLVGSWAKPLSPSVLNNPSVDEHDNEHGFRDGLVVLKKKSTRRDTATLDNSTEIIQTSEPTIFCGRGPKDTSKLMARLWDAVALHEKRARDQEALKKKTKEEEANLAEKRLLDQKRTETKLPVEGTKHQTHEGIVGCDTSQSLCDVVRCGSIPALIQALKTKEYSIDECNQAIRLSISLDQPDGLRILCNHLAGDDAAGRKANRSSSMFDSNGATNSSPLLYAVSEQRNACLQAMLSAFRVGILTSAKDEDGNSALHVCCRMGTNETFLVIVNFILSQRNAQSNLLRCLSDRNTLQQTPIHVICEGGHTELLDTVLTYRPISSISLLLKLMVLQDENRQTPLLAAVQGGFEDIVMSLLMWRGNNSKSFRQEKVPSALTWAVRACNKGMVLLLLEFNSTESNHGYDLEEALGVCVEMRKEGDSNEESLEMLAALITAGANPFQAEKNKSSALDIAVYQKDAPALESMLKSYDGRLKVLRDGRRKDPKLQMQPKSFFKGLIDAEESEKSAATGSALVYSLFHCWNTTSDEDAYAYAACAMVLCKHGTRPGQIYIERLQRAMRKKDISCNDNPLREQQPKCVSATYDRLKGHTKNPLKRVEALSFWSQQMISLPWYNTMDETAQRRCAWEIRATTSGVIATDAILLSTDNNRFAVHSDVLLPCEKLAASVRFVTASELDQQSSKIEVKVGLDDEDLTLLLEHLYHGSMSSFPSKDPAAAFSKLIDMMLISEEYLCVSLLQECEMRLLASSDTFDCCFCCFCLARPERTDHAAQFRCTYEVSGPSALMDSANVVDLLAVLSQLSVGHMDYCVEISEQHSNEKIRRRPLEQLREQALIHVVSNFGNVTKSDAWKHHVEGNDANDIEASFLRLCLDDLSDSFIDAKDPQALTTVATRK